MRLSILLLASTLVLVAVIGKADGFQGLRPHSAQAMEAVSGEQAAPSRLLDRIRPVQSGNRQSAYLDMRGALPSLEERLPVTPLVVTPNMEARTRDLPQLEIGHQGGILYLEYRSRHVPNALTSMLQENLLGAPGLGTQDFYGNIVQDIVVHPGNTHFRFTLRQGLKWSDGAPVTTDDVAFAYTEVWQNENLNFLGMPTYLRAANRVDGTPATLKVEDDYVFHLVFDTPYGGFLGELGNRHWRSYADLLKPLHHLRDFHPAYISPEQARALLQARNLRYQWELFRAMDCDHFRVAEAVCQDFPVLWPWYHAEYADGRVELERNLYYFKVDAAGNQLPYMDRVTAHRVDDISGSPPLPVVDALALLTADALPTGLDTVLAVHMLEAHTEPVALYLNLTYPDEAWRTLVSQPDFRRALQLSVDQAAIVQAIWPGQPLPAAPWPREFAPAQARRLLEGLGMNVRNTDGWRLYPSGTPFIIAIEYDRESVEFAAAAASLANHLADVGLQTALIPTDTHVLNVRRHDNQVQASLAPFGVPLWESGTATDYLPNSLWGRQWRLWYDTGGQQGESPPAVVHSLFELHQARVRVRAGSAEEAALLAQIHWIHRNHHYIIALTGGMEQMIAADPDLRNIPHTGMALAALKGSELFYFASPPQAGQ